MKTLVMKPSQKDTIITKKNLRKRKIPMKRKQKKRLKNLMKSLQLKKQLLN